MARRNHHATRRAQLFHVVGNRWRRNVIVGQKHGDSGIRHNFGHRTRRAIGGKARVVANDDAFGGVFVLQDVRGNRARDPANILKRKIVRDQSAPAVGSKFNFGHWSTSSVVGRQSLASPDSLCFTISFQTISDQGLTDD